MKKQIKNLKNITSELINAAKLSPGDIIKVTGWVMLKGLEDGKYYILISDTKDKYVFKESNKSGKTKNKRVVHYIKDVEPMINPNNDNRIEKIGNRKLEGSVEAAGSTKFECMECGNKFKKKIGPKTFEVKCPKCGGYDTEIA